MSSNLPGVFHLSLESTLLGVTSRIASEDIRMEDLLQAKYEKRSSFALFDGKVKVNFERFLFQINKKYVSLPLKQFTMLIIRFQILRQLSFSSVHATFLTYISWTLHLAHLSLTLIDACFLYITM
jgi:hypothetical protein